MRIKNPMLAPEADKLRRPVTLSLTGDVTGSCSIDGSGDVTLPTVFAASHALHVIHVTGGLEAVPAAIMEVYNTMPNNSWVPLMVDMGGAAMGILFRQSAQYGQFLGCSFYGQAGNLYMMKIYGGVAGEFKGFDPLA